MKKAYAILAHNRPEQLLTLIDSLDDGESRFFIHLDKRTSIDNFKKLRLSVPYLVFVKRVAAKWGTFSLVQATLNCLQEIKESGLYFDRIILLSGHDYPIKSNAFINDFLQTSPCKIFIDYVKIPDHNRWRPNGGLYRINKYFFGYQPWERLASRSLNFISAYIRFLQRKPPKNVESYGGSQWWIIDNYAMDYILDFVKNNPSFASFHKHTFAADEVFFHSILLNAGDAKLRSGITNDNKRFMKWEDSRKAHPDVLRKEHLDEIASSEALFARKFDSEADPELLGLVDRIRLRPNTVRIIFKHHKH